MIVKNMRSFLVLIVVTLLLTQPLFSQSQVNLGLNRFSLGLNAGLMTPFTDIKQKDYFPVFDEMKFGGSLDLEYHFTPVFALRGQFLMGQLSGLDDSQDRYFETELWDATLSGVLSLSKLLSPRWSRNDRINIFATLGVGMVSYRSKLFNSVTDELVNSYGYSEDGSEKENRLTDLAMPIGMGISFNLTDRIDLSVESNFRFTQTDKLDAVSRIFSKYDVYNFTGIGLSFKLGKNNRSMKWASPSVVMYPGDVTRMEYITQRVTEVDRRVEQIDQSLQDNTYDRDIAELRQQLQAIDLKHNELSMRVNTLSEQKPSTAEASVAALLSVYFRLNSAAIDNYNYERIASAARFMIGNPDIRIELVGHTDITGPSAYNLTLSETRAQAVYDVLVNDFKVNPARLIISHRGPDDPLSQQNLSINRRVDFIIRSN
jgi:outer membrane protein OmpA-like peptidoglycan-associated protein/opacity protein-like surface antigen